MVIVGIGVGTAMSDSKTEFDGEDIPEKTRAELALSLQYLGVSQNYLTCFCETPKPKTVPSSRG